MPDDLKDIDKFEERGLVEAQPKAPINDSPMAMIQIAMQKGYDVEQIKQMLELQEKFEARQNRKAYIEAITAFKAKPPSIRKDKTNKQFNSKYSSIEALVNPTVPFLSEQGLSHNWQYTEKDKVLTVTCTLSHVQGHQESVSMSGPPDTSGAKNDIQQIKSTITYLKIATFEAITGLVGQEGNLDDDGNASGGKINLVEQWEVKCNEVGDNAKSVNEIATWWKQNAPTIKKDLSKPNAAKIYDQVVAFKNKLKTPEREPGSEG